MQKADNIPVRAVLSNFRKGEQTCYRLEVKRTKAMTQEEFVKMYAEKIEKDPAKARFYLDAHNKCLAEAVEWSEKENASPSSEKAPYTLVPVRGPNWTLDGLAKATSAATGCSIEA